MTAPDSAGLPGSGFLDFIESHRLMPEEHKYTEVLRHAREIEAMRARENAEWLAENRTLTAELAEARAKLARVEALHKPLSGMAWDYCEDCEGEPWPCPTYEAIHGDAAGNEAIEGRLSEETRAKDMAGTVRGHRSARKDVRVP